MAGWRREADRSRPSSVEIRNGGAITPVLYIYLHDILFNSLI
jgi:hypothetical protein